MAKTCPKCGEEGGHKPGCRAKSKTYNRTATGKPSKRDRRSMLTQTCPTCKGSGKRGARDCGLCRGTGQIEVMR